METKNNKEIVSRDQTSRAEAGGQMVTKHSGIDPSKIFENMHVTLRPIDADGTDGVTAGHRTSGQGEPIRETPLVAAGLHQQNNQSAERPMIYPLMPKVPTYIQEKYNSEDYVPLVASFGPYYGAIHNNPANQRLMFVEKFKPKALEWFVRGTGSDENSWLEHVRGMVPDLRLSYPERDTYKYHNYDFALMMLQDACLAILIMGVTNQEYSDMELLYNHLGAATVVTVVRDSFLLQNQIPFVFIRALLHNKFGVFKGEARWRKHIVATCHGSRLRTDIPIFWAEEAGDPDHFVEALKITHLAGWKRENKILGVVQNMPTSEVSREDRTEEERSVLFKDYYAMHSVTELKGKGIYVEPNQTNSFKNITFKSGWLNGTLQLPVDYVNYSTRAAYSNIIAYEMSPGNHSQDYTMTAYVHLMKSLLQTPMDVEELQANGTIVNMLGSDLEVIDLYRDIYTFGTNCSSRYGEICQKMVEHYNNKTKTWFAEFMYTYFRSPWTVIALVGSVLVVILTFIQTYYAAKPK
ncbi:hypothetical protein LIER_17130 [Lithospermum erythrorhizon]|uniref:Uncharacterized protein n=1 Tax=Lithospermum erythrorhizon TaxID=34254 RepID=A0AAV3Q978_LITER